MTYGKRCVLFGILWELIRLAYILSPVQMYIKWVLSFRLLQKFLFFGMHFIATKKKNQERLESPCNKRWRTWVENIVLLAPCVDIHATCENWERSFLTLYSGRRRHKVWSWLLPLLVDVKVLQTRVGEVVLDGENLGWIGEFRRLLAQSGIQR